VNHFQSLPDYERFIYTVQLDYDPQPHPNDPSLASTHPDHKHVPSDIKHNRIPAPGLSFTQPNLPLLIREIEQLLQFSAADAGQAG
jgi:hypothetical protein